MGRLRRLAPVALVVVAACAPSAPLADGFRAVVPAKAPAAQARAALVAYPEMLPDGQVTENRIRGGHIRAAYLVLPTRRYGHGILGDRIEAGGIHIRTTAGRMLELVLPEDSVFEDLRVRLADVDGDGRDEAIVVHSYLDRGAALAVYRIGADRIEPLAETPSLGIPNRWLNPVGVADFDGDGRPEIALVTTPHIGGTLKLYRLENGGLSLAAERYGFSNHRIGSRELDLSAILDFDGDGVADIVLPDDSRRRLRVVTFAGGKYRVLAEAANRGPIDSPIRVRDADGDGRADLVYTLEDGSTFAALR